jgi:hypothetical protein
MRSNKIVTVDAVVLELGQALHLGITGLYPHSQETSPCTWALLTKKKVQVDAILHRCNRSGEVAVLIHPRSLSPATELKIDVRQKEKKDHRAGMNTGPFENQTPIVWPQSQSVLCPNLWVKFLAKCKTESSAWGTSYGFGEEDWGFCVCLTCEAYRTLRTLWRKSRQLDQFVLLKSYITSLL